MRPESKRGVALSELACAGYGEMPVRTVPLEQDSVSHFFPEAACGSLNRMLNGERWSLACPASPIFLAGRPIKNQTTHFDPLATKPQAQDGQGSEALPET